jgi:TubC N-terminal docking domain
MRVPSLLVRLRATGVSISGEGERLVIDAPKGVITAELRAEVASMKFEILRLLEAEAAAAEKDFQLAKAIDAAAGLLAGAYKRHPGPRPWADQTPTSSDSTLALSGDTSVHGGVS